MSEALTGLGVGAAFAATFFTLVQVRLDQLNQGLLTSAGLVALIGTCLWLDGWILTGLVGFVVTLMLLIVARTNLR